MIKTELQKQINNEKPESNEQIGKFENSWERRMNTVHQTILIHMLSYIPRINMILSKGTKEKLQVLSQQIKTSGS